MTGSRFSLDVRKWVKQAKVRNETFPIELANDLAKATIEATPVVHGFLRGSWYASVNDPLDRSEGEGQKDKPGKQTAAQISLTLKDAHLGDKIYLLNSASYARHVEFGTATQRPQAFIRGTLARAEQIASDTAKRIQRIKGAA